MRCLFVIPAPNNICAMNTTIRGGSSAHHGVMSVPGSVIGRVGTMARSRSDDVSPPGLVLGVSRARMRFRVCPQALEEVKGGKRHTHPKEEKRLPAGLRA